MTKLKTKNWQTIRAKGKVRFILIYGILLCAIPIGLFTFIVRRTINYIYFPDFFNNLNSLSFILIELFIWLVVGIIIGMLSWAIQDKYYSRKIDE